MNRSFTYASAFAGIGGMTLGLKPLGGVGVAAWEYDPTEKRTQYAQGAHKLLHPEIPVYGDICEANTDELPNFDLFCFTPPCQAFSVAGKRKGFEDTRGTLTFEALRIAKAKQPKVLFMENVKGLVNHDKGNTMGTILHAINEIGYTVDYNVINSKYFQVAQNRERVYLIAVRNDLIAPEPWNDVKGNTMLPKSKRNYQEEGVRTFNFDWPEQNEVSTRLRDFLEEEVDDRYYLSEEKTSALVKKLEEVNYVNDGRVEQFSQGEGVSCCLDANYAKGTAPGDVGKGRRTHVLEGLPIREATKQGYALANAGDAVNIAFPNSTTRRGRVGKGIANTIEASGINQGVVEKNESPIMVGHLDMKGMDCVKRVYDTSSIGPTITTMGGGHREPKIATNNGSSYVIRKLTPTECLKLQSIPNEVIQKLKENFSDSRLYKFAGNGLTTNVINAIGEKLLKYL